MSKNKLLIFHPFLTTYRLDLYNYLSVEYNLKVVLYNLNENKLAFDKHQLNKEAKFNFSYLQGGFAIGSQILNFGIVTNLLYNRPNIVFPHEFGFNTIAAILLRPFLKYKIYVTCDDSPDMAIKCSGLRALLRSFTVNKIDGLIVIHPDVESFLLQKYKQASCKFLFLPIVQDEILFKKKLEGSMSISDNLVARHKLRGRKVILYVGRLEIVKSIDVLIQAFNLVSAELPNTVLVIVGGGQEEHTLKTLVENLNLHDSVIFTGKLTGNDLYAWYNIGQLFVLPSNFEPFGAVVNEALIAGCYTIVSNKVGANSLIDENNGDVFISEDYEQLTLSIIKLLDNFGTLSEPLSKNNLMQNNFQHHMDRLKKFIQH